MNVRLHINVDHAATVRNARGTTYPDPVLLAQACELASADGITAHLREDRRHIRDADVVRLRAAISSHLNLECAATEEMFGICEKVRPDTVTLVPERREEQTTEGGLNVAACRPMLERFSEMCEKKGIRLSLFIAPDPDSVRESKAARATQIELHTGEYCHRLSGGAHHAEGELLRLKNAASLGASLGLVVAAGHGLTRHNLGPVVAIPEIVEVNIGHAVIADALFLGIEKTVAAYREAILRGRS